MPPSHKRRASVPSALSGVDDDDDDISLASTELSYHSEDEEFSVERVLAETEITPGEMAYLVEWSEYPMHRCTWEPDSNLGPDVRRIWEQDKELQATGEKVPFDLNTFSRAVEKAKTAKEERHRRRNARRRKLGMPLTEPLSPASTGDSSDEAFEDNEVDQFGAASVASSLPKTQLHSGKQRIFKGTPGSSAERRLSHSSTNGQTRDNASQTKPRVRVLKEARAATTGYQGTARRPSLSQAASRDSPSSVASRINSTAKPTSKKAGLGLTARKTGQSTKLTKADAATKNVFAGGTTRKQRMNLEQAMTDTSKDPRFFKRFRVMRLAALTERSKADRAPDPSRLDGVFQITHEPKSATKSHALSDPTTPAETENVILPGATTSSKTSEQNATEPAKKKPRKSVRFLSDDDPGVEEPMDVDGPVATSGMAETIAAQLSPNGDEVMVDAPTSILTPASEPTLPSKPLSTSPDAALTEPPRTASNVPRKLSLADYHNKARVVTQAVEKTIRAGFSDSKRIQVTFDGLPRESHQSWLSSFEGTDILDFNHICHAATLSNQIFKFYDKNLSSGNLFSATEAKPLKMVAERLRIGSFGLLHYWQEYCIIIYPTKCEDWKLMPNLPEPEGISHTEVDLRYFIFQVKEGMELRLFFKLSAEVFRGASNSDTLSDREAVLSRVFNFDYQKLLPTICRRGKGYHSFFLAFPQTREDVLNSLCKWLRACEPSCRIYTSREAGGWSFFRDQASHGSIIIHDSVIWSIRRFPNILKILHANNTNYNIWCYDERLQLHPTYPSIVPMNEVIQPGSPSFVRLFPHGNAVLLTPSFLLTEPRLTYEILKHKRERVEYNSWVLVTAWNVVDYLRDLAFEKSQKLDELERSPSYSVHEKELGKNLHGVHSSDCEMRYKIWMLASDMMSRHDTHPLAFDDFVPIIYADSCIDANDEQSLVNWFGWWSLSRLDQFRKFHVVGSSIKHNNLPRASRVLNIPLYRSGTLNDPDAVLDRLTKDDQAEIPSSTQHQRDIAIATDSISTRGTAGSSASLNEPGEFRSLIISNDSWSTIGNFLRVVDSRNTTNYLWRIYTYPVSWEDFTMADHFDDTRADYKRFKDWFDFTWPFSSRANPPRSKRPYNTYIGFFYTILGEWDQTAFPRLHRPRRHPWLGIYRPMNPHWGKTDKMELIIWDALASKRFPNQRVPNYHQLPYMQRQLISFIRDNTGTKNPGSHLEQVWLGGFALPPCDPPHAFDVTINFLERLATDIRDYLPAPDPEMPHKGFRKVFMPSKVQPDNADPATPDHEHDDSSTYNLVTSGSEAEGTDNQDGDMKIIFHAPRGAKSEQPSKCRNHLFEQARLARLRDRAVKSMTYTFPPTMTWYTEQAAEGRGFEHINIDTWENVLTYLKIGHSR